MDINSKRRKLLENISFGSNVSHSIPFKCYSNSEIFKFELSNIFKSNWIGVGHLKNLAKQGDYYCKNILDKNFIFIRDKNLVLRAFLNTCRHRGAKLLKDSGNTNVIRCPFHSWAYGLDGKLVASPKMNELQDFIKSDYGLIEFKTLEVLGFIFICFEKNVISQNEFLDNFEEIHSPWPFKDLVATRTRTFNVKCNWKIFLEVFNEHYHLPYIHPDTIGDIYNDPNPPDQTNGFFVSQYGDTKGTGALLEKEQNFALPNMKNLNKRFLNGVRYTWIYPNLTFAVGRDSMWMYVVNPVDKDNSEITQSTCFPKNIIYSDEFKTKSKFYYSRMDAAIEEDITALENQQDGLKSSINLQGRFAPLLEANVSEFAKWYSKQLLSVN